MQEYTICYKGELYITVFAENEEDAREVAAEIRQNFPGYFKVWDTDIE